MRVQIAAIVIALCAGAVGSASATTVYLCEASEIVLSSDGIFVAGGGAVADSVADADAALYSGSFFLQPTINGTAPVPTTEGGYDFEYASESLVALLHPAVQSLGFLSLTAYLDYTSGQLGGTDLERAWVHGTGMLQDSTTGAPYQAEINAFWDVQTGLPIMQGSTGFQIRPTSGTIEVNAVVPEPLTLLVVGGGVVGLAGYVRRRRAA